MTTAQQYRKKPVVNWAVQWTGDNTGDVIDFVGRDKFVVNVDGHTAQLYVAANNAWLPVQHNEWVIHDDSGFYPCLPERFAETYELVRRAHPGSVGRMLDTYQRSLDNQLYGSAQTVMECIVEDLRKLATEAQSAESATTQAGFAAIQLFQNTLAGLFDGFRDGIQSTVTRAEAAVGKSSPTADAYARGTFFGIASCRDMLTVPFVDEPGAGR